MVINHGDNNGGTDQFKETMYHEMAHVAHYPYVGHQEWIDNGLFYASNWASGNNPPYGDGTGSGSGRTAVIEMWGFHYGPVLADRQYGLSHSNGGTLPQTVERRRHIYLLERFTPVLPPTTSTAWIPQGVFLDCMDNNVLNPPGVVDGVGAETITGFSHSNFFSAISTGPSNPTVVRNNLTSGFLPPGQTIAGVNALFALYGF